MDGEIISERSKFDSFSNGMSIFPPSSSIFYLENIFFFIVNHPLWIDISKSRTNDSLSIQVLDKGNAPQLNKHVLWPSSDHFAFGGEENYLDNPWYPPDTLSWQVTADGKGGGRWDVLNANADSIFLNLARTTDGLGGVADDTGWGRHQ